MTQNVKIHTRARLSATDRIKKCPKNFSDFFFFFFEFNQKGNISSLLGFYKSINFL